MNARRTAVTTSVVLLVTTMAPKLRRSPVETPMQFAAHAQAESVPFASFAQCTGMFEVEVTADSQAIAALGLSPAKIL